MKQIPNFPNYYVTKEGKVFSALSNKYLKGCKVGSGYLAVYLMKNKKRNIFYIHRLVMLCYNGYSQLEVNHIDGDKTNNNLFNLEYCTRSENGLHRCRVLGKKHTKEHMDKMRQISSKKYSKKVLQISINGKIIKLWNSISEASRNGFTKTSISDCCNGKLKTHKNFIWKFS